MLTDKKGDIRAAEILQDRALIASLCGPFEVAPPELPPEVEALLERWNPNAPQWKRDGWRENWVFVCDLVTIRMLGVS